MNKNMRDNILLALFGSAIFGFMVHLIFKRLGTGIWYWGIVAGVALAMVLVGYLLIYDHTVTKRYAREAERIGVPVRFFVTGNIRTELGRRGGNIYYCDDRIVAISLDKKPHVKVEIRKEDVESFECPRLVQVCIRMTDGTEHMISSTEAGQLAAAMKKKHWGKEK